MWLYPLRSSYNFFHPLFLKQKRFCMNTWASLLIYMNKMTPFKMYESTFFNDYICSQNHNRVAYINYGILYIELFPSLLSYSI